MAGPEPTSPHAEPGREAPDADVVLVVEDDQPTRLSLQRFLQRQGWNAIGFGTAAETQAWLAGSSPVAGQRIGGVVIDVHLPDGDGIDLTRTLREHLGMAVPIVIVSGDTSIETLRRLRDAGGNRFVGKPMSLAALQEALAPPGAGKAE